MGLFDLIKTRQERNHEEARKRRRAFRAAETSLGTVKDRSAKLRKDRDQHWLQAREYLQAGQKAAAQRSLQSVRSTELLIHKVQQKEWVFEQLLTRMDLAKTDNEFADALKAISTVVNIDPEHVDDVMATVEDKLGDQGATDKIWDRMHAREMDGVEGALTDRVPTLDDLMADLEDEVAETQSEESPSRRERPGRSKAFDPADTEKLRERARKIVDGNS